MLNDEEIDQWFDDVSPIPWREQGSLKFMRIIRDQAKLANKSAAGGAGPVAWVRMRNGEIDWREDCLYPDDSYHMDYEGDRDNITVVPLYAHPSVAGMPDSLPKALALLRKIQHAVTPDIGDEMPHKYPNINRVILEIDSFMDNEAIVRALGGA